MAEVVDDEGVEEEGEFVGGEIDEFAGCQEIDGDVRSGEVGFGGVALSPAGIYEGRTSCGVCESVLPYVQFDFFRESDESAFMLGADERL